MDPQSSTGGNEGNRKSKEIQQDEKKQDETLVKSNSTVQINETNVEVIIIYSSFCSYLTIRTKKEKMLRRKANLKKDYQNRRSLRKITKRYK